ncbi:MAG: hypothetical protein JST20_12115 [Bacteroidetes bacterium]|nr:hypothetical protein [Bacteroidota bacterium]
MLNYHYSEQWQLKHQKQKLLARGKTIKAFPNNLPEGRIYSRRVDISIEKKAK